MNMTHVTLPILEDWEGLSLTTILQENSISVKKRDMKFACLKMFY